MIFEQYGDAKNPSILFLHGAMTFNCFERQKELAKNYHLIFYTLPGHGRDSEREFDRQTAISEAVGIINSLNKKDINVVGFSLGAQLALQLLDEYYSIINKVILVSPLVDSAEIDEKLLSVSTRIVGYSSKVEPLAKIIGALIGIDREHYQTFKREQKSQKVNKLASQILKNMLRSEDLHNIADIENEVLILAGEFEMKSFKNSAVRLSNTFKHNRISIYEGAGHNIPYKFFKRFNNDLADFIV